MASAATGKERFQKHARLIQVYESITDHEILNRNFQFVRDQEKDDNEKDCNWEIRMSVKYYNKLFKEYALADLSRYKEGKIGLRWRTESEVKSGKGQFICGNKKCSNGEHLHSYELLFAYMEQKKNKKCLVKVRVCPECALRLFYKDTKKKSVKHLAKDEVHAYVSAVRNPALLPKRSSASSSSANSEQEKKKRKEQPRHEATDATAAHPYYSDLLA